MSLMKACKSRRKGAGNSNPNKRHAFPDIDQNALDDSLDLYVRTLGQREAFNLYAYKTLQAQMAESPQSFYKLHGLLDALIQVEKSGCIKYKYLKSTLSTLQKRFGADMFHRWEAKCKEDLPGQVADCLLVLLKHWRRSTKSMSAWSKMTKGLDDGQAEVIMKVFKKMEAKCSPKKRKLQVHVSDVTVDSEGFPALLDEEEATLSEDERSCSLSLDANGFPKLDKLDLQAAAASPPPVQKKDWRSKAAAYKRPALKKEPCTKAKSKPCTKAKSKTKPCKKAQSEPCTRAKADSSDVFIHQESLVLGGGKHQTYIQHRPGPGKNLRLVVAVSEKQSAYTKKSHRELVDMLMAECKLPGATKATAIEARQKLLEKYKK